MQSQALYEVLNAKADLENAMRESAHAYQLLQEQLFMALQTSPQMAHNQVARTQGTNAAFNGYGCSFTPGSSGGDIFQHSYSNLLISGPLDRNLMQDDGGPVQSPLSPVQQQQEQRLQNSGQGDNSPYYNTCSADGSFILYSGTPYNDPAVQQGPQPAAHFGECAEPFLDVANPQIAIMDDMARASNENGLDGDVNAFWSRPAAVPPIVRAKKNRSSEYRGVSRHCGTLKWEAHMWDSTVARQKTGPGGRTRGKQVYLGSFGSEMEAARAYDLVSIVFWGEEAYTNFPLDRYADEMEMLRSHDKESIVAALRQKDPRLGVNGQQTTDITKGSRQKRLKRDVVINDSEYPDSTTCIITGEHVGWLYL